MENENTKLIQAAFGDYQKGDLDSLLKRMDESITWETPFPTDIIPFGGKRKGKEQVKEFFATLAQTTEMLRFEPREFIASNENVVVLGFYESRVHKTGRSAGTEFVMIFRVQNGKIVSFKEFTDTHTAVQAWQPVAVAH